MPKYIARPEGANIPIDGNEPDYESSQYSKSFITTCVKELMSKGECICFTQEHLKAIKERIGEDNIEYQRIDEFYYRVLYIKKKKRSRE